MGVLLVSMTTPATTNFIPKESISNQISVASSLTIENGVARSDDYTTYRLHKEHQRSASMMHNPTWATSDKAAPVIAKTPGATTNLESIFRKYQACIAQHLNVDELARNRSAASLPSLQTLGAAEAQNTVWGKAVDMNQPKSMAVSPPSQSIFDDTATSRDPNANPPETSRTGIKTKIARRKRKEIEYTIDNYIVQSNLVGNVGLFRAIDAIVQQDKAPEIYWIGTLGMPVDALPADVKKHIADKFEADYDTFLVFVNDTDMNSHYENYCKNILWPMLHSQVPDVPKSKAYQDNSWSHYKTVNQAFADCTIANYKEGDVVWINDYHLMLVPSLVRQRHPQAQIGFYFHCAFPPSEIFRNLPSRLELIDGVLGANLIAFQTEDFRYQFLQTCSRLLNIEVTENGLVLETGRFIDVFAIPIGIDIETMDARRHLDEVRSNMQELSERFAGKHVIMSRDKLDGVHGLKHKLRGFAEFLDKYPQWQQKVVLVQIATSATQDVELRDTVNNLITEINSDWGDLSHQPIVYLNQDIEYAQYLALLSIADCMLVTSLSEGMNLTCHEFVLCQDATISLKGYAPLVISEFIGASKVFDHRSILINPWHPKGIAEGLNTALSMGAKEKRSRWQHNMKMTRDYCAKNWYYEFTKKLQHAWDQQNSRDPAKVPRMQIRDLRKKYIGTEERLLIIDFEGTLTTWDSPKESVITVPLKIVNILTDLVDDEKNTVYIMSLQTMDAMEHMFRNVQASSTKSDVQSSSTKPPKLGLIAENGAFLRKSGQVEWTEITKVDTSLWREGVMGILSHYKTSIPGSIIREIKSGIIYSYFDAVDQKDASHKAGELANQINEMCEFLGVTATPIDKGLNISPTRINKALATKVIERDLFGKAKDDNRGPDFVLAIGDSYEDECVFEWAHKLSKRKKDAIEISTCVVGSRVTQARGAITQGTTGVISILDKLSMTKEHESVQRAVRGED